MTPAMAAVAAEADDLGFVLAGAAPLGASPRGDYIRDWLADGRAGEMTWLERRVDERLDPGRRFDWARSVMVLAWPYPPPPPPPGDWRSDLTGRLAAFALGRDYHQRVRGRLGHLVQRLERSWPGTRFHRFVDTGPLLEREFALRAGLGWIGRNTLVLHRRAGSWFVLGCVLTSAELEPTAVVDDHCGSCVRCVAACPTGALEAGYTMDPRRCISYLTIEHRSALPLGLRAAIDNWVFGCDVCQTVCPWNATPASVDGDAWLFPSLPELLALDERAFRARFRGTAVLRATRRGLVRNAAVALGNTGNPAAVPSLRTALGDPDALVRAHVAWSLGRIDDAPARSALERQRGIEPDLDVRAEIESALAGH